MGYLKQLMEGSLKELLHRASVRNSLTIETSRSHRQYDASSVKKSKKNTDSERSVVSIQLNAKPACAQDVKSKGEKDDNEPNII